MIVAALYFRFDHCVETILDQITAIVSRSVTAVFVVVLLLIKYLNSLIPKFICKKVPPIVLYDTELQKFTARLNLKLTHSYRK